MINPTWLGLTNAFPTLPSADGMLAETERATDPMASRCLTIDGGSPWGGGSSNPMTGIFPNGDAPRSLSSIERVAASNHWIEPMSQGTVFVWVQNVAGSAMPRLNTLSIIPAEPAKIYETATDVDAWADWMPRFQRSRGIPSGFKNSITHEVLMDGGPHYFHYQSRMEYDALEDGYQILWRLEQRPDFQVDRKSKGLRINDGSWTLAPLQGRPGETLMAYQIHVEPQVNGLLLKTIKPLITALTLSEFDKVIAAIANRSVEPAWTQKSGTNPSGRNYRIRKV